MMSMRTNLNQNQAVTLNALRGADRPLSAYDVLDALRQERPSAAPPTAYRALDKLIALGLAHRLESVNAYVACTIAHHGHDPLFAICDDCGAVDEMADPSGLRALTQSVETGGFSARKPVVELHGQCVGCQRERS
ncbi:MAG: transcriptional repressor [Pseudomonadota bacterium]